MPGAVRDLSSFYAVAGYSIPSSPTSSSANAPTSPTPTGSSAYGTSALVASASRTESSSGNQTPTVAPSGWSSAAKAGIGVGNGVAIALLVCLVIVFLRRQRRKGDPLHLPSDEHDQRVTAAERHGIGEVDGNSIPAELGTYGERYEM